MPIFVTLEGILTLVRLSSSKAEYPIQLTLDGIVKSPLIPPGTHIIFVLSLLYNTPSTDEKFGLSLATLMLFNFELPLKTDDSAILVILEGISSVVKLRFQLNAEYLMLLTVYTLPSIFTLDGISIDSESLLTPVTSTVESGLMEKFSGDSDASTTVESYGMLEFSLKMTSSTSSTLNFLISPFFCFTIMSDANIGRHNANEVHKVNSLFFISKTFY